jgi:hypothetical protein
MKTKIEGHVLMESGKLVTNDCEGSFRIYPTKKAAERAILRRDAEEHETVVQVEIRFKKIGKR